MMQTKDIKDYIKSAPTSEPSASKQFVSADAQGQIYKVSPFIELKEKEPPGTIIDVVDFAKTYLQDAPVGAFFSDSLYQSSRAWVIKVNDTLTIAPQSYMLMMVKKHQNITQPWSLWSFLALPAVPGATPFVVFLRTTQSATNVSVTACDFLGQPL